MFQSEHNTSSGLQAPVLGLGLWYDPERLVLEGIYEDEVSAYRARRSWIRTFEKNFLLEESQDFKVKVGFDREEARYHVKSVFLTACGRYAFWRLTHHQAPDVQYALETAHLPHSVALSITPPLIEAEVDQFEPQIFHPIQPTGRADRLGRGLARSVRSKVRRIGRILSNLLTRTIMR